MPRLVRSATGGPGGAAYPSYASDSSSKFAPQIWSALMVEKFYPATVIGDIANVDYEGEITGYGDSVRTSRSPLTRWA